MKRLISFSSPVAPSRRTRDTKENQVVNSLHHFRRQVYNAIRRHTPSVKAIVKQLLNWSEVLLKRKEHLQEEKEEEGESDYWLAPETYVTFVFSIN